MRHMSKKVNALLYFLDNHHCRLGRLDNKSTVDGIRALINVGCQVDVQLENDYFVSNDSFFVSDLLITLPSFITPDIIIAISNFHADNIEKYAGSINIIALQWN